MNTDTDSYFKDAVDIVQRKGYITAAMQQRQFDIGYNRAGRLIDQLEYAPIIGPVTKGGIHTAMIS